MDNQEISKSAMEAAAETIQVLKGTVESLQMNLDQERDAIDGKVIFRIWPLSEIGLV